MSLINTLRYYGRSVVLPAKEIRNIVRQTVTANNVTRITDFGSGMFFWSKWFAQELKLSVMAADTLYAKTPPPTPDNMGKNITAFADINDVMACEEKKKDDAIALFICDVIHHLPPNFWQSLLPRFANLYDVIIIKDIDATHSFGNFANRMHDRIINGEEIYNVYPDDIKNWLEGSGFIVVQQAVPKLWYPHFIIVGSKK